MAEFKTDIQIAQECEMENIRVIAERAGVDEKYLEMYGNYKAKVDYKLLKDNADNLYREDILYYTAMASYHYARMSVQAKQKERYLVFVDDYLNFVGEYPESDYRSELDGLYKRAQRILGRNTAVPGVELDDEEAEG